MNSTSDFELTVQEIDELKAFITVIDVTDDSLNPFAERSYVNFSEITDPLQIKEYVLKMKTLAICDEKILPESIQYLKNLEILQIFDCPNLTTLPESLGKLHNLQRLEISRCHNLTMLPESIGELSQLQRLSIVGLRSLVDLPKNLGQLKSIRKLQIIGCSQLTMLPEQIGQLQSLRSLEIISCINLSSLPESMAQLKELKYFDVTSCHPSIEIPKSVKQLPCFTSYKGITDLYKKLGKDDKKHKEKVSLTPEQKQAKKVLTQIKKDTATPFIKIKSKKAKKLPLTANKFGGVPYWDLQKPYPVDNQGNKLILLAQIDLAELPPLPDFPEKGLLQFFLSPDEKYLYGLDLDKPLQQDGWRVVYHENIDKNISEEMVLALDIPTAEMSDNLPLSVQYKLSFKLAQTSISPCDYRFEDLFKTTAQQLKITFDKNDEIFDLIDEDTHEKLYNSTAGHHIGGYPIFTQDDPRNDDTLAQYKILLLQIDTEGDIMWGDAGVGNFFITADDLKKRDFSRVLYNWDCA